ncbi:MAG: ABC transporter ATP-binding protein [Acidilobaceae archaeon]|nr:ABC transporter ATP-binding protein [Acidilobaceae archaeon]MCX8165856.1 ABC transporter ATP-binding protein [Acidilobaceae archaeon]MDW7974864.1 ABC transporter ATP-binding protein [Sulfolobales archaeon]
MRLELREIAFSFGDLKVFDHLNASFNGGNLNILIGPNGVGKSTLLKIIAGILKPSRGEVFLDGAPPARGEISYLPQDNELLPWFTVRENVELPLKIRGISSAEGRKRAEQAMELTGVLQLADRYPRRLSGGERKRAAIARALVAEAKVLLLDEPTANVDPAGKEDIWRLLKGVAKERITIAVTHDIAEALLVGDFIYVLSGRPARIAEVTEGGERAWERLRSIVELYYRR